MRILVTGAHGLLGGSLLVRQAEAELIGSGRRPHGPVAGQPYIAADLTDRPAVEALLSELKPDWVIHTAALTDVDRCQSEPELARKVNVEAVEFLAAACRRSGAGMVHLSTDYVFDGEDGPYGEQASPRPLSRYGAFKLESERCVLEAGIPAIVLRTLWLYGYIPHARRNLVTWPLEELAKGRTLRQVDDQWGNPTYVHELADVLLELCRRGHTGLYHMGGGSYLTRYQMAVDLARFFGLDSGLVQQVSTAEARQAAPRPLRSGLRTDGLEALLGRPALSFRQGLEAMARDTAFRRDFAFLK